MPPNRWCLIALAILCLTLASRHSAHGGEASPASVANVRAQSLVQSAAETSSAVAPVSLPEPSLQATRRYHSGNVLWVIATLWGLVVPALIFFTGLSARVRDLARGRRRSGYPTLVIYVVVLTCIVFLANLPLDYYTDFVWVHDYGLSSQAFAKWFQDELINLVIDLIGGALFLWIPFLLLRRAPRRWWLYSWLASIPIMILIMFVRPIWIDPLFNQFAPLHDRAVEARITKLASRAGIQGAAIYEVNKSVDTNLLNAYVTGIGDTRRIVLWDTTLKALTPDEIGLFMSHEMGHYALSHAWKELAVESFALLVGLGFVHISSGWVLWRSGARTGVYERGDVASLPLLMLVFNVAFFVLTPPLLAVYRHFEREADRFALEMTHDNHNCGTLAVKYMKHDLAYPTPSPVAVFFRSSHPPLGERLEFCNTYHPWLEGREERYSRYFTQ
jgi:STE24 endopeptidase